MKFTDDDLKRLKDNAYDYYRDGSRFMWIHGPEVSALLARLQAAERVILESDRIRATGWHDLTRGLLDDAIKAWRKAAGK